MDRPKSIVTFERVYLGAWAIGLINTAVNYGTMTRNPDVAAASAQIGGWYMPTVTAIGLLIPLILWFFIARRGSAVAKWIMVVLTGFGVLGLAYGLATARTGFGLASAIGLVGVVLNVVAATMLFRADTPGWFGEVPAADSAA